MLGNPSRIILYLPNPPLREQGDDAPSIIQANGNHWRKILSIYAKLMVSTGRWQDYRDECLLNEHAISFNDALHDDEYSGMIHWIAGKASWERLGGDLNGFVALDEGQNVWYKGRLLLTPYPDYRQFPNRLVEDVRVWLAHPDRFLL